MAKEYIVLDYDDLREHHTKETIEFIENAKAFIDERYKEEGKKKKEYAVMIKNTDNRNCDNCKKCVFKLCYTLKSNENFQKILEEKEIDDVDKFLKIQKFKKHFICDEYNSMFIEYPIEVSKINSNTDRTSYKDSQIGKFAKISPCGDEYRGKTYLGLYLGELPEGHFISHNPETKELDVSFRTNPAIYVFDLKKIIFGMESWWGIIESEDDLKEITEKDINNIWYVKALKSLIE